MLKKILLLYLSKKRAKKKRLMVHFNNTNNFKKMYIPIFNQQTIKETLGNKYSGRGKIKVNPRRYFYGFNYYEQIKKENGIYDKIFMKLEEFEELYLQCEDVISDNYVIDKKNILFLCIYWIRSYIGYSELEEKFNIGKSTISKILNNDLKLIAMKLKNLYILNDNTSQTWSCLSINIKFVIDSTYVEIRKPTYEQKKYFRGGFKYSYHGINNHIAINFDSIITSFLIGIPGSYPDSIIRAHKIFDDSTFPFYSISDPGYTSCSYIINGLRKNQINNKGAIIFDRISRIEQKRVEHVFKHLKEFKIFHGYHHSIELFKYVFILTCCVYNFKKIKGYY